MKKRDLRKRHERRERRRVAGALPNPTPAVPLGQHADWQQAVRSHRAGQLQAARDAYCRVLKQHPRCGPAWHMLGMLMHQGQDHAAALDCLQQALAAGEAGPICSATWGSSTERLGSWTRPANVWSERLRLRRIPPTRGTTWVPCNWNNTATTRPRNHFDVRWRFSRRIEMP